MDYKQWQDQQRHDEEFMASTRSVAALIVAGIVIGMCMAAALWLLVVGG